MTGISGQLNWEPLKKRRKDNRLILLCKGLKGKASLPTDDLIPLTQSGKTHRCVAFLTPTAGTDIYKGIFFPWSIRNSEYDQKIQQSQTADIPMAPRGRAIQQSRDTRKIN